MAKHLFISGTAKWAKLDQPDQKYGYYGLDLYLDSEGVKLFKDSDLALKLKDKGDGAFISPKRDPAKLLEGMDEKPKKLIRNGDEYVPFDGLIGNDSKVTCKLQVFKTKNGMGHRLEAVAVEELVPYEGDEGELPF